LAAKQPAVNPAKGEVLETDPKRPPRPPRSRARACEVRVERPTEIGLDGAGTVDHLGLGAPVPDSDHQITDDRTVVLDDERLRQRRRLREVTAAIRDRAGGHASTTDSRTRDDGSSTCHRDHRAQQGEEAAARSGRATGRRPPRKAPNESGRVRSPGHRSHLMVKRMMRTDRTADRSEELHADQVDAASVVGQDDSADTGCRHETQKDRRASRSTCSR
jgi:hypothetical protein